MTQLDRSGRDFHSVWVTASVVGTTLLLAACGGGGDGGKLVAARPEAGYILPLEQSDPTFTLGSLYIERPGAEIHVLRVDALTSPNVQFIGAVNVWPRDSAKNALADGPGFPAPEIKDHHPMDEVVPASETDIQAPPGASSQPALAVAVGFRLVSGDLGAVNGVRISYTADGKQTADTFRQSMVVCVKPRPCGGTKDDPDNDFNDRVLAQFGLLPDES